MNRREFATSLLGFSYPDVRYHDQPLSIDITVETDEKTMVSAINAHKEERTYGFLSALLRRSRPGWKCVIRWYPDVEDIPVSTKRGKHETIHSQNNGTRGTSSKGIQRIRR